VVDICTSSNGRERMDVHGIGRVLVLPHFVVGLSTS